ncbi:non-ribosomal peptide synthetase [Tenacibaculum singaporense]|uniref:non-ribosomal peptide synthetase n=1 Tax=Tenacibaculum singaporense TaxID=2358479 RepID=UPI00142D35F0|nr:non-ribosomal peptide synthetase [Tenacibaculum singaporense]
MKILSSYHQQRLWFIDYFEKGDLYPNGPVYHNIPLIFSVKKQLSYEDIEKVVYQLLSKNEVLRTSFSRSEGTIFQEIHSINEVLIDKILKQEVNLLSKLKDLQELAFTFDNNFLIKCYFENLKDKTLIYFVIHHALIDRKSIGLIKNQLISILENSTSEDDNKIQFQHFSNWQNNLSKEDLESLLFYWRSKLNDLQVLYYPTDFEREQVHIYKAKSTLRLLDRQDISQFAHSHNLNTETLFLSAYKMALAKLTGLNDIVIGTLMDLRNDQIKELVGPIENLVVLRSKVDKNKTLEELLFLIEEGRKEAEKYKTMPFDKLVLELNPKKDMSRTALFDIFFNYEKEEAYERNFITESIVNKGFGKYDFNLLVTERNDFFHLGLTYNELYFQEETANSLLNLTIDILNRIVKNNKVILKEIPLVSGQEYNRAVGSTSIQEVSTDSIIDVFSKQVKMFGSRLALSSSLGEVTYEDLDNESTKLANYLINNCGVLPEDRVAIMIPKSIELIVAIIGVLKTGAAYVPIDINYPDERKNFMIEDSECRLVIDESFINKTKENINRESIVLSKAQISSSNLAYIIYTSGTTGKPKGVMIEHKNVLSLLTSCYEKFEFSENDTWTFFHSYCFDFSIWEIFGALLTGANVLILNNDEVRDHEVFVKLMNKYNSTVFSQTPSAFYNFIALNYKVPTLRYVVFGGEALHPIKLKKWRDENPEVSLVNMYGITETTVHVTFKELSNDDIDKATSNIGKPLSFANSYIVDQDGQIVPFGRPGELYVSGNGVARGYLNRPDQQEEKFLPCPFDEYSTMYRTGDLARFLPSGELEYLGRIDDQVKIRGYRIELDEIKKQIDSYKGIKESAITLVELSDGDKVIAAYVVLDKNESINSLKLHLSSKVPEYMVPAFFIEMDQIPINSNGKIDKVNLPSPFDSIEKNEKDIKEPITDVQIKLFNIWKNVLNTESFGIEHNFFELGGHSLKATRLISAIHKEFEVRLELKQIFANPTLEQQALLIEASDKNNFTEIKLLEQQEFYPVSDGQKRLWVLSQFEESSVAYNMASYLELDSDYDVSKFERAIQLVLERHEILRTVFKTNSKGEVVQKILEKDDFEFKVAHKDFSSFDNPYEEFLEFIRKDKNTPFNLSSGPLFRGSIIKFSNEKTVFYYNMHHIISDGWSIDILRRDVLAYYENLVKASELDLPSLKIQYKDYASWQQEQVRGVNYKKYRDFWLEKLKGELPLLDLPYQKNRPKIKTYNGGAYQGALNLEQTKKIKEFVQKNQSTLFVGLVSIWNLILHKYSGNNDIVIGTSVAGREHEDLKDQIGFFVNTIALRNYINPKQSYQDIFQQIDENTLEALENQMYPFDRLIDELDVEKSLDRSPVFDVMLVLQNTSEVEETREKEVLSETIEVSEEIISKFDLEIFFQERKDQLWFQINYNKDVYKNELIPQLIKHFKQVLDIVIFQPEIEIENIEYLSEEEETRLLESYNDTQAYFSESASVIDLFTKQVNENSEAIALKDFNGKSLNYRELDILSNKFAHYLIDNHEIKRGDLVGINIDRSVDTIVVILGILKIGAAYLPLDSNYPQSRIDYIQSNSKCKLSVDETILVEFNQNKANFSESKQLLKPLATDLAYVIYTSGSTGKPKGVMIEHGALLNYLEWGQGYYLKELKEKTDFGLFTSLSFDLTITSLFLPLISGATLNVFSGNEIVSDSLKYYFESDIPCIKLTPAHIILLGSMEFNPGKKELIIVGGEALTNRHINILRKYYPKAKIINEYGPTEATVGCVVWNTINLEEKILIGKPIGNTAVYVLDDSLSLVAEGVLGELYISGSGLSRGYLHRPDLTIEHFIPHPFKAGERLYKTGDVCRWLPGGVLEYVGRIDDQVKIRGHRIELGEIEGELDTITGVESCVVSIKEVSGEDVLVAYFVGDVEGITLRKELESRLPSYMVPHYYVSIDAIPLTSNGKVSRSSLPEVSDSDMLREEFLSARNEEEKILLEVCESVLQRERISVLDNFYNLGGDSIKSIQVVSRLKALGYQLGVSDILSHPVLSDLSLYIKKEVRSQDQSVVKGDVVLSPIQQHFFKDSGIVNTNHYNQSVLLKSKLPIDKEFLGESISKLLTHHDALRMIFSKESSWSQYNREELDYSSIVQYYDLTGVEDLTSEITRVGEELQSSVNILTGDLVKVAHIATSEGDYLGIIIHHLVVDGVSWRILLEDLSSLYTNLVKGIKEELPLKTSSYQRWSKEQYKYSKEILVAKELSYWENLLAKELTIFPVDHTTKTPIVIDSKQGFRLSEVYTNLLEGEIHSHYSTNIQDVLLACLGVSLSKTFGVKETLLELEGHGRQSFAEDVDVTRTVGWFTSLYPYLLNVDSTEDLSNVLIATKDSLRNIPNNGIGYGMLHYLSEATLQEIHPTIQFNYLGTFGNEFKKEDGGLFSFSDISLGKDVSSEESSNIPLRISGAIVSGQLQLSVHYSSLQYEESTIKALVDSYESSLKNLISQLEETEGHHLTPSDLTYKSLSLPSLSTITKNYEVLDVYELSPLQQGMYYHWLQDVSSSLYFEQLSYKLSSESLDLAHAKKAYEILQSRHDVLRTGFTNDYNGIPLQIVYKEGDVNFKVAQVTEGSFDSCVKKLKEEDRLLGFDLSSRSQMRLTVLDYGLGDYEFIWSFHHILMDGWCISILLNEYYQILNSIQKGTPHNLNKPLAYSRYIEWLGQLDQSQSLSYWKDYLSSYDEIASLPYKGSGDIAQQGIRGSEDIVIESSLYESLSTLCKQHSITQNTFIQGVWGYLLSKYNNSQDVVFGSVVSGRPGSLSGVEHMVGLFINTIPVRVKYDSLTTGLDLLNQVHQDSILGQSHHYLNLSEVQSNSGLGMDLINHVLVFENFALQESIKQGESDLSLTITEADSFEQTHYDFGILVHPQGDSLHIRLEYDLGVYSSSRMSMIKSHFEQILTSFITAPDLRLSSLEYLTTEEKHEQLELFNATKMSYDLESTLVSLFKSQVLSTPDLIAVSYEEESLTYQELDELSNSFAHYLQSVHGVERGELVGLKLGRGLWMIVGILGVLKTGGAYVPIDIHYPESRKAYIIEDSGCNVCIDDVLLEDFKHTQEEYSKQDLAEQPFAEDLAYIIYTSGSTGKPKGVMIEHRNVVNLIISQTNKFKIDETEKVLQFSNISFDASVEQIFLAILNGSELVLVSREDILEPTAFEKIIINKEITHLHATPSYLKALTLTSDTKLKRIIAGGEACSSELAKKLGEVAYFYNEYGPTETTVTSIEYHFENQYINNNIYPIGKPIGNTAVYVLDDSLSLVAEGVLGELYISGSGLSRGYLHRPDLTIEHFIPHPFKAGERLYKTGDVCRWLPGGVLEYVGRIDDQVKIRGHRIELGEIEGELDTITGVESCVVSIKEVSGEDVLVAYFVGDVEGITLRKELESRLPSYMVPHYYVSIDAIPLTSNGKVSRSSLPEVSDSDMLREEFLSARNEEEKILLEVCESVLQRERISVLDNFYNLGGDSIKSIQVVSRLKALGYQLGVSDILSHPVLSDLSLYIKKEVRSQDQSVVKGDVVLSPIQQHFFKDSGIVNTNHYNQSVLLKSKLPIDKEFLGESISKLLTHHDALRMIFSKESSWSQYNREELDYSSIVQYYDLTGVEDLTSEITRVGEELQSSVNILTGDLVKVAHIATSEGDYLGIIIHHLVVDGVSWRILLEDLSSLYTNLVKGIKEELPLKTSSYQRWSKEQYKYSKEILVAKELSYWENLLAKELTIFPVDHTTKTPIVIDSKQGFRLSEVYTNLLEGEIHSHYSTNIQDVLLACLGVSLSKTFGVKETLLELEGHGRQSFAEDVDVTRTVGWFTSLYPYLLNVDSTEDLSNVLIATKDSLRNIPNNGIGYGMLHYLSEATLQEIHPTIQFNYLGTFGNEFKKEDGGLFSFSDISLGKDVSSEESSNIPLRISGAIVSGQLQLSVHYSSLQYEESTIKALVDSYESSLKNLISQLEETEGHHLTPSDLTYKSLSLPSLSTITKNYEVLDVYELSPLQQGMYYHWLQDVSSSLYFEQLSYKLSSESLDLAHAKKAYEILQSRHDVLRTGFTNDYNGIPLQIVYKEGDVNFKVAQVTEGSFDSCVKKLKEEDRLLGFDLSSRSQMRLTVLDYGLGDYEFIWSFHHILMDGWCISILLNEYYQILNSIQKGTPHNLNKPLAYSRYIEWLGQLDQSQSLSYWKDYLSSYDEIASLPYKGSGDIAQQGIRGSEDIVIESSLYESLSTLCKQHSITQNTFIQGVWGYLLSKYNNSQDVVFGSVVSGRPGSLSGVEHMVGLFINTIPVRVKYDSLTTGLDLLNQVHQDSILGQSHHYLNLSEVQSNSGLGMDLINHVLVFENFALQESIKQGESDLSLTITEADSFEQTHYDFGILVHPQGDSLHIRLEYDLGVYSSSRMSMIKSHFEQILTSFITAPDLRLSSLEYLTTEEKHEQLELFNATKMSYDLESTLVSLFKSQVLSTPDLIAVSYEEESLTYQELDELSNSFAHYLQSVHGVERGELVGLKLGRGLWMIVGILGVLKTGGAYVPIDIHYPESRKAYIIEDSGCNVCIDDVLLEDFKHTQEEYSKQDLAEQPFAEDLAYIIYTSGSTGKPKGVMIEHRNVVNTILSQIEIFNLKDCNSSLQFASFSFDASVSEIFISLLSGTSLHIATDEIRENPKNLEEFIIGRSIDIATIPPAYLKYMDVNSLEGIVSLITAGESPDYNKVKEYLEMKKGDYFNAYGPTEASICGTVLKIGKETGLNSRNLSIGKPIHNVNMYVVDNEGCIVPKEVVGEICISGYGVARGYLNKPELTKEKFIETLYEKDGLLYKTGDLGYWTSEGNIVFIGRKDDQVKINGYRIELEEIAAKLREKSDIKQSYITVFNNENEDKELIAYIISNNKQKSSELRKHLVDRLPTYMIPSYFIQIDELPITTNGKIDKKSLPLPDAKNTVIGVEYVAPQNGNEEDLIKILSTQLGIDSNKIGVLDNFFDLGMNSIKLMRFINVLNQQFNLKVKPVVLFQYPNIKELTLYLFKNEEENEDLQDENIAQEFEDMLDLMEE